MFHMLVYTKADTAGASNEDIPGVSDGWATLQNNHYILQQDAQMFAAYWQNAGATNARVNTPHFRFVSIPSVQPINVGAAPITLPPLCWFPPTKLTIPRLDEVAFEASNSGAGGVRGVGIIWVGDGNFNIPQGDIYTIRATGVIAANSLAWTLGQMTFDQTLPQGNYAVVGMDCIGTNLVCARLQFTGGAGPNGMRPGVIARPAASNYMWEYFRRGDPGLFGTFANTSIPNLEIFSNGANTAQTVFLDVIRLPS